MKLKEIALEINKRSTEYEIGNLQSIRKDIRGSKGTKLAPNFMPISDKKSSLDLNGIVKDLEDPNSILEKKYEKIILYSTLIISTLRLFFDKSVYSFSFWIYFLLFVIL